MTTHFKALVISFATSLTLSSGAALAQDRSQLAASAGVSVGQAARMSLNELSALKSNQDRSAGDWQAVNIEPGTNGADRAQLAAHANLSQEEARGLDLTALAAHIFNRNDRKGNRQTVQTSTERDPVTMSARNYDGGLDPSVRQLALSAGLTEEEARGMSLRQIAAHAFNSNRSPSDWQRTDIR